MTQNLSMDQVFINKLITIIDSNLEDENFGVLELASEIDLSRSQLHRRLQQINGKSTTRFIREYRLQKALEMLKQNVATASEIAYKVGFSSPTYFNRSFHNLYGYPPGEAKIRKSGEPPKKSLPKKMMSVIPLIILISLIAFNEFGKTSIDLTNLKKTIAVMPFVNDSSDDENLYFCNGIMAGIRDHLAKIPEIKVLPRRSVEKYRDNPTPLNVIAKELDVNYLIEGRVQRIGDRAIITTELILAKDNKVLWSESYDKDVSEIFDVQASVIHSVTDKLDAIIAPNLKIELNREPTQDKLAYEYYLKGQEYRFKAYRPLQKNKVWLDFLSKAKLSYELAIKQDSLYAPAYLGLAMTVFEKNVNYVSNENNLDEVLMLTNKVLQLNRNSSLAYLIRGDYYSRINQKELAIKDYEKNLEIIPNNSSALYSLFYLYKGNNNYKDALLILKKLEKFAISRDDLILLYNNYIIFYRILEQHELVDYYYNKKFETQITPRFDMSRAWAYMQSNRFDEALKYTEAKLLENNQQKNGLLAYIYLRKKDFSKALQYYKKCYKQVEVEGVNSLASTHVYGGYGQVLIEMGEIEKGKEMIQKQISLNNQMINSKREINKPISYLSNTALYAYLDQYERVYDNIKKFEARNGWLHWEWMVTWVKTDFAYDLLRDDPIFKAWIKRGEQQLINTQKQIRPHLPSTLSN
jgi:TolB-like protein/AraC-like DNA-binding protein/Tfp pilus assembly protein PilF